jgi:hypothetical protein
MRLAWPSEFGGNKDEAGATANLAKIADRLN